MLSIGAWAFKHGLHLEKWMISNCQAWVANDADPQFSQLFPPFLAQVQLSKHGEVYSKRWLQDGCPFVFKHGWLGNPDMNRRLWWFSYWNIIHKFLDLKLNSDRPCLITQGQLAHQNTGQLAWHFDFLKALLHPRCRWKFASEKTNGFMMSCKNGYSPVP